MWCDDESYHHPGQRRKELWVRSRWHLSRAVNCSPRVLLRLFALWLMLIDLPIRVGNIMQPRKNSHSERRVVSNGQTLRIQIEGVGREEEDNCRDLHEGV